MHVEKMDSLLWAHVLFSGGIPNCMLLVLCASHSKITSFLFFTSAEAQQCLLFSVSNTRMFPSCLPYRIRPIIYSNNRFSELLRMLTTASSK
uniref:Uncharacterized protein n=1 Tax=Pseudonaja textilis TaxID=8673 RepID=A0A670ZRA0_PSETE